MFTFLKNKVESQRQANMLQARQDEIRKGFIQAPSPSQKAARRPFAEVAAEYLAWGNTQGGRGGRPWSPGNARKRRAHLGWWQEGLKLKTLGDLDGALPRAEKALQTLVAKGRSGKTLSLYREGLFAFCHWCKQRRYLAENPFENMAKFNAAPKVLRRAITLEELSKIFEVSPDWFRLVLEVALCTGFRRAELLALTPDHLDRERCFLRVDADVDKGRRLRYQPIPRALVERLDAYLATGEAETLYTRHYSRKDARFAVPRRPLLFVPLHTARTLDEIMVRAGVPKSTDAGIIDFHAMRTGYINLLLEGGNDAKTVQELARHSTPHLTMNVYGRARDSRMVAAVENLGQIINQCQTRQLPVNAQEGDGN